MAGLDDYKLGGSSYGDSAAVNNKMVQKPPSASLTTTEAFSPKSPATSPRVAGTLTGTSQMPEYKPQSASGNLYDRFGLPDARTTVEHYSYGTGNSKFNTTPSPKTAESLTDLAQKPTNYKGNIANKMAEVAQRPVSAAPEAVVGSKAAGVGSKLVGSVAGLGSKLTGGVGVGVTAAGLLGDTYKTFGTEGGRAAFADKWSRPIEAIGDEMQGSTFGLLQSSGSAKREAAYNNARDLGMAKQFNDPSASRATHFANEAFGTMSAMPGVLGNAVGGAYNWAFGDRSKTPDKNQVVVTDPAVQKATMVAKAEADKKDAALNTALASAQASQDVNARPALQGFSTDVPDKEQMVQAAERRESSNWYPKTPTAPSAEFPNQPGVSAMTPEQFVQQRDMGSGLTEKRPSDYLKPILHAALLAKPGTQQAIDAQDAYHQVVGKLDADHDKRYTPVDPKTGQRYEVQGGLTWKDGTPVRDGNSLGSEVAELDRQTSFNQTGSSSPDNRLAHDAEVARLAAGHNGREGDHMRDMAPEGKILNPRYQGGFGSSRFNDTPGANALPDDAYLTPQEYRERQNTPTYSDIGAGGNHVRGQMASYDGQGGLMGVRQYDASPEARAKAEAGNAARVERANNPIMQTYDKLSTEAYNLRALANKSGENIDEVRAKQAEQGLMAFQAGPMAEDKKARDTLGATERVERYKADADSGKTASLTAIAARKEALEMDKENAKQAREDREYKFKVTKEASNVVDSTVKNYFPDEKDRETALRTMANMANSGQLNNEMILNWRTWLPLVRQAVEDESVKTANSGNIFTKATNVNAPTNFGQGAAFGSYTSDSPEDTESRVLGGGY